jgi:hypothetical protein
MTPSPLIATAIVAASVVSGCGGSGPGTHPTATRPGAQMHIAASCPMTRPARSSPGSPDALAPDDPASTSFCVYRRERVASKAGYAGGPLDSALNSSVSKLPPNTACASVARLPSVVVLRYRTGSYERTRYIVLDMGGCPRVVMSNGTRRLLIGRAAGAVLQAYAAAFGNG